MTLMLAAAVAATVAATAAAAALTASFPATISLPSPCKLLVITASYDN